MNITITEYYVTFFLFNSFRKDKKWHHYLPKTKKKWTYKSAEINTIKVKQITLFSKENKTQ